MMDYLSDYETIFNRHAWYDEDVNRKGMSDPVYTLPYEYLVRNKDTIKSHIDISSGRGWFLKYVLPLNINTVSTDLKKFNNYDLPFIQCDLTKQEDLEVLKQNHYDVLTATGMLEHIEEEKIDEVLETFAKIADVSLLTIANHEDVIDGIRLHITNKDIEWWKHKLEKYFVVVDSKTTIKDILFYFEVRPI